MLSVYYLLKKYTTQNWATNSNNKKTFLFYSTHPVSRSNQYLHDFLANYGRSVNFQPEVKKLHKLS